MKRGVTVTVGLLWVMLASVCDAQTCTVPSVAGMTETAGTSAITAAGLALGNIVELTSESVGVGYCIETSPVGGSSVACESAVDLHVSIGTLSRVNGHVLFNSVLGSALGAYMVGLIASMFFRMTERS